MFEALDHVRPRRPSARRLRPEFDGDYVNPRLRQAVLVRLRDRREAVDRLTRQQRPDDHDAPTAVRWSAMTQRVRLAASRAELAEWRAILDEL